MKASNHLGGLVAGETAGRGRDDGVWGFEVGHVHFPGVHFGGGRASSRRAREGTAARLAGEGREGTAAAEVAGKEGAVAGRRGHGCGARASARARRWPRGQGRGGAMAWRRRRDDVEAAAAR
jgi:hypothetical protein